MFYMIYDYNKINFDLFDQYLFYQQLLFWNDVGNQNMLFLFFLPIHEILDEILDNHNFVIEQ